MKHTLVSSPWHLAILIPARNEEQLIRRCLESVQVARRALPWDVTTDVVVVSDSSTDGTEREAVDVLGATGLVARIHLGSVGAARARGAELALSRSHASPSRCWLANTDADCVVPRNWLLLQLAAAQGNLAALAGIVDVDSYAEHLPIVEERFRLTYHIHPDGTHPHVHGANLGCRADAYLAAGGWGPQLTAEDHDLWRRLRSVAAPCIADASVQVITSGRRVGRAPHGFAEALGAHNEVKL